MDKKKLLNSGLIESYVLGLCTGSERKLVEEWAQKDEEIAGVLKSSRHGLSKYCRSRIRSEVETCRSVHYIYPGSHSNTGKSHRTFSPRWKRNLARVSALVLLSILVLFGVRSFNNEVFYSGQGHGSDAGFIDYESYQIPSNPHWFIKNSQTIPVVLSGSQEHLGASGIFYWNPYYNRGFIRVSSLPTAPRGRCFHLWADMPGKIVNIGNIDQMVSEPSVIPALSGKFNLNLTLEKNGRVTKMNNTGIILTGSPP